MTKTLVERLAARVLDALARSPMREGREIYIPLDDVSAAASRIEELERALGEIIDGIDYAEEGGRRSYSLKGDKFPAAFRLARSALQDKG